MRLFLLAAVLLSACQTGTTPPDLRPYYFPTEKLRDGQVYEYSRADTAGAPEYWYYRGFRRDSGLFLTGTYYDGAFRIGQIVREKILPSGARSRDYFLYETDSTGRSIRTTARIESPDVFPFHVTDTTGIFLFSLRYQPPTDSATTIYLIRNRRYLGAGPDFAFQGAHYPTVRFSLREVIGNEREGAAEVEGRGEEHYAKGLGLVYYEKRYGSRGQVHFAYRLKDRFGMEELEKRAGAVLKEE